MALGFNVQGEKAVETGCTTMCCIVLIVLDWTLLILLRGGILWHAYFNYNNKIQSGRKGRKKNKTRRGVVGGKEKGPGVHMGSCRGPRNRRKTALHRLARRHLPQCLL